MSLFCHSGRKFAYSAIALWFLLLQGCSTSSDRCRNTDLKNALWITDAREEPDTDSLMYGNFPAPMFRKEFNIKGHVKTATLYITAAGYYNPTINGKTLNNNFLDPAWTDFSKRIYYTCINVTPQLRPGVNCLGIVLGNGFYNPLPMKMWGRYNLRKSLHIGNPAAIARLAIEYTDGKTEDIVTDKTWKYSYGPIIKNNVYLGEVYDAGQTRQGWDTAGYDGKGWQSSVLTRGPDGTLLKAFFPPVQSENTIKPVAVTSPSGGTFIVDFGVNFTGLYRIRLKGQPGDTIKFRFGERLYEDGSLNPMTAVCGQIKHKGMGGPGAPDIAWQTDSYIFGKSGEEWYSPVFTFHVFRYLEITGLKYKPDISDTEGIPFHTNVAHTGTFQCSSDLLNSIQDASSRTFLNNLISVQSDCPGREKFGYGGDLNATADAFLNNFDMQSFYRKTLYDWVDVLNDSAFVDTAPYVKLAYCGISWESAFIITQDKLLLYYNDTSLIRELYKTDLKWMEKAARIHPAGVVDKGLADHESLEKVPVQLIGTTHYLDCARIMQQFAAFMHDFANEEKFKNLSISLEEAIRKMYWERSIPDTINRQTLFSTLLYYNIVPANERQRAVDSLMKAVKKAPSSHFTTGIFGTKYVLESLSSSGEPEEVFNVVNSKTFPGWGFMIDRGATTIWETWKESDNIYSNCHPMFGSVSEWFFRWLGGIRPDPLHPGFREFIVGPVVPEGLKWVKCNYQSPMGIIRSDWEKTSKGIKFDITVPEKTEAIFIFPDRNKNSAEILTTPGGKSEKIDPGVKDYKLRLEPGTYSILY